MDIYNLADGVDSKRKASRILILPSKRFQKKIKKSGII